MNICDPSICAAKKKWDLLILGPENEDYIWGQGTQTSYNYKRMYTIPWYKMNSHFCDCINMVPMKLFIFPHRK